MRDKLRVPHFQTYIWLFLVSAVFTLGMFGISKQGTATNADLAEAGARVTLVGCNATNTQGEVLANALRGNLASLELRLKSGETNLKSYKFAKELLVKNLALVESTITDCSKRAEELKSSVHG